MNLLNNESEKTGNRRKRPVLWAIGILVLVAAVFLVGRAVWSPDGSHSGQQYHCPMHPTVISDQPGDCPVCGMRLVPIQTEAKAEAKADKYICPMHPTIISDKPGECPVCFMDLVPMKEEVASSAPKTKTMYRSTMNPNEVSDKPGKDAMGMEMEPFEVTIGDETSTVPGLAAVSISTEVRHTMGLKVGMVERRSTARKTRTSAVITADETRLYDVTVRVEGWIDKLFVSVTGQEVKKGDPLLTLYSSELVSAQNDYLIAWRGKDTPGGAAMLDAAKTRLAYWQISDAQIRRLESSGVAEQYMTLYAPASGVVTEKHVVAGNRIMPNAPLMTIADLSVVWGDANIYQSDLPHVRLGMPLELTLPYWPGKTFDGKVIFVSPVVDPDTRTLKARLEIPNPEGLLKPGMYGDAELAYERGESLVIPATAVMMSGTGTYAFKDGGDGRIIPVAIKVGTQSNGDFELLEGLNEGDHVVVSANFLVDSESSMRSALDALTNGSTSNSAGDEHAGHRK